MKFKQQFIPAILNGDKTATCRVYKPASVSKPRVGDVVELCNEDGEPFAKVRIVKAEYRKTVSGTNPIWLLGDCRYTALGHGSKTFPQSAYMEEFLSCYPNYSMESIVYYEWDYKTLADSTNEKQKGANTTMITVEFNDGTVMKYDVPDNMEWFAMLCNEMAKIAGQKNHDYSDNTKEWHGNFKSHGLFGMHARLTDKIQRLDTLMYKPAQVESESIKDTLVDLASYALLMQGAIESGLGLFGDNENKVIEYVCNKYGTRVEDDADTGNDTSNEIIMCVDVPQAECESHESCNGCRAADRYVQ